MPQTRGGGVKCNPYNFNPITSRIEEKNTEIANGKLNTDHSNDTKPYIAETYINGTSGYRLWSDGYCMQWGIVTTSGVQTITLPKGYISNQYPVFTTQGTNRTTGATNENNSVWNKTSKTFTAGFTAQNSPAQWMTIGYLAKGEY